MSGFDRRRNAQEYRNPRSSQESTRSRTLPTPYTLSPEVDLAVMEALDHIHIAMQYSSMGLCATCKRICIRACTICGTFYCNTDCQRMDWFRHRSFCAEQRDDTLEEETGQESDEDTGPVKTYSFLNEDEEEALAARSFRFSSLTGRVDRSYLSDGEGSQSQPERREPVTEGRSYEARKIRRGRGYYGRRRPRANRYLMKSAWEYKNQWRAKDASDLAEAEEWFGVNEKFILDSDSDEGDDEEAVGRMMARKRDDQMPAAGRTGRKLAAGNDDKIPPAEKDDKELPAGKGFTSTRPKFKQMEVIATSKESTERYWVLNEEDLEDYGDMQIVLNDGADKAMALIPEVGLVCACNYFDGEWARCKIMTVDPMVTARFIDIGFLANCEGYSFRRIPEELVTKPPMAFLVEFDDSLPEQYKITDLASHCFVIEWKRITSDGVPLVSFRAQKRRERFGKERIGLKKLAQQMETSQLVHVSRGPAEEAEAKPSTSADETGIKSTSNQKMVALLSPSLTGMIMLLEGEGKVRYGSLIIERGPIMRECIERVIRIFGNTTDPISAQEDDYVLVIDRNGHQQRGKVLNVFGSIYFVHLVDCGDIMPTDKVYRLPPGLDTLPELGVIVKIEELTSPEEFRKLEICFFEVLLEYRPNKWLTALKDTQKEKVATVLLEPPPEGLEWEPKRVDLVSGSEVEITAQASPNEVYVRCTTGDIDKEFLKMNMEVIEYAPTVACYEAAPSVGELCCAKFEEDGCFYRCVVIADSEDKIRVFFIDFGNEQETELKDLKPLTESLEDYPMFAVRVKLRNVSSDPWNSSVQNYVDKLSSEFVRMILTYEGSLSSGVVLKEKESGTVLNDYINNAKETTPAPDTEEGGGDPAC